MNGISEQNSTPAANSNSANWASYGRRSAQPSMSVVTRKNGFEFLTHRTQPQMILSHGLQKEALRAACCLGSLFLLQKEPLVKQADERHRLVDTVIVLFCSSFVLHRRAVAKSRCRDGGESAPAPAVLKIGLSKVSPSLHGKFPKTNVCSSVPFFKSESQIQQQVSIPDHGASISAEPARPVFRAISSETQRAAPRRII